MPTRFPIALAVVLAAATAVRADPPSLQPFLARTLEAARARGHVPGMAAWLQVGDSVAEAAVGVRAVGHPEAATVRDRWHLGSDTKAFTATLIARLAEKGVLGFGDTLAASFPSFAREMDPAYRDVTIAQLLSHTAGLPPLTNGADIPAFLDVIRDAHGVVAQRAAVARKYLTMPPASRAGDFAYSNLGYIIVGAIAEARTGKPWEVLLREEVFAPLGITHAGFGAPGTPGKVDQPRGHLTRDGGLVALDPADPQSDNPPALGPAGTLSMTLDDWARFARDQLDGARGHGKLLRPETYRRLQTPVTGNYALGWGAKLGPDGSPVVLAHTGSNGYWLADIRILPAEGVIELIAMNAADKGAQQALEEIQAALRKRIPAR